MTPEEVGARLAAVLEFEDVVVGVSGGGAGHERATVDVPPARWWAAVRAAQDPGALGCDFFDWLSAVDELAEGFTVVAHLWSTRRRHGLLLRTRVPREDAVVESVVDLFPGAAWHERETHEMFGIGFARNADLAPLLLPPDFEGHPLRKEFVLASRVAKAWPGAKEPGESESSGPKRAAVRPPGVPDPNEWGPLKGTLPETAPPARRAPRAARPEGAAARPERAARPEGSVAARPEGAVAQPEGAARPEGAAARPARPARRVPAAQAEAAAEIAAGQAEAAEQADAAGLAQKRADAAPAPPPPPSQTDSPHTDAPQTDSPQTDAPRSGAAPSDAAEPGTPRGEGGDA
jgi:NADH-quinone oxidoreductase subunit C